MHVLGHLPSSLSIAVVRLDNIGDHVLGSDFFKGLRLQFPNAHITAFVSKVSQGLYLRCPYINHLVVIPVDTGSQASSSNVNAAIEQVKRRFSGQFYLTFNPRFGEDFYDASRLITAIGAPLRIAFEQNDSDVNAAYTHLVPAPDHQHAAQYSGHMLKWIFKKHFSCSPEVWWNEEDQRSARHKIEAAGWDTAEPLLILAAGASNHYRIWPDRHVQALGDKVAEHGLGRILQVGGDVDTPRDHGKQRMMSNGAIDGVGLLSLAEFAATCHLSKLFIGTDSGPKHIAAAAGLDIIEIGYLPSNRPSQTRGRWTSGECWQAWHARSMTIKPNLAFTDEEIFNGTSIESITPSQVLAAIDALTSTHAAVMPGKTS